MLEQLQYKYIDFGKAAISAMRRTYTIGINVLGKNVSFINDEVWVLTQQGVSSDIQE